MASPHSSTLRSLYRRILRELPSCATESGKQKLSNPSALQQRIRTSFITSTGSTPAAPKIQEVEQFVHYIQAQRMYATLIERYNPGMGMNGEERVRLTARRVGMDLPVEVKPEKKWPGSG
ncbi:uncharacterized protein K441DRAFT_597332 [Cenococcum geophilum 1.58]|uniref:Uncharacterized protein n=1 Tax=Cenococcum geophilum 1.58 TaxID=794803 RepID=A0ACC8EKS8_9PEZI|nr:hypothetical protein K441DRAFT_597332 [Cenococcum geophilum 1.58]